jgi:hypothetical protein
MKLTASEADVQRAIIQYLRIIGAVVIRVNSGAMQVGDRYVRFNSEDGCSDLVASVGGRFVAVETKRPGWTAAPPTSRDERRKAREAAQRAFIDRVNRSGGLGLFARSVEDVAAALRAEGMV